MRRIPPELLRFIIRCGYDDLFPHRQPTKTSLLVPSYAYLLSVSLVCHLWNDLAGEFLWRVIRTRTALQFYSYADEARAHPERAAWTQELNIKIWEGVDPWDFGTYSGIVTEALLGMTNITTLSLADASTPWDDLRIGLSSLKRLINLTWLDLGSTQLLMDVEPPYLSLRHLGLSVGHELTTRQLQVVTLQALLTKTVTSLRIGLNKYRGHGPSWDAWCASVGELYITPIARVANQLTSLDVDANQLCIPLLKPIFVNCLNVSTLLTQATNFADHRDEHNMIRHFAIMTGVTHLCIYSQMGRTWTSPFSTHCLLRQLKEYTPGFVSVTFDRSEYEAERMAGTSSLCEARCEMWDRMEASCRQAGLTVEVLTEGR